MLYRYKDKEPELADDVFVAPDATVIGDVTVGRGSGIWFGCLVRGDVHYIRIGENTNIQDHSVLHVTGGKFPLEIGDNVSLGHRVTVHGCRLQNHAFVGIGATVLDDCEIGEFGLLAAGSLLAPGKKIPPRMVAMGVPAKVVREINAAEEAMILGIPEKYKTLKEDYLDPELFSRID